MLCQALACNDVYFLLCQVKCFGKNLSLYLHTVCVYNLFILANNIFITNQASLWAQYESVTHIVMLDVA